MKTLNYSANENLDLLLTVSRGWSETYDFILNLPNLEDWEKTTIYDLLLSEKVFDV